MLQIIENKWNFELYQTNSVKYLSAFKWKWVDKKCITQKYLQTFIENF